MAAHSSSPPSLCSAAPNYIHRISTTTPNGSPRSACCARTPSLASHSPPPQKNCSHALCISDHDTARRSQLIHIGNAVGERLSSHSSLGKATSEPHSLHLPVITHWEYEESEITEKEDDLGFGVFKARSV